MTHLIATALAIVFLAPVAALGIDGDTARDVDGAIALLAGQQATTIVIDPDRDGVHALTTDTHADAVTCGQSGQYPLCAGTLDFCPSIDTFMVALSTPFARVAASAHTQKMQFDPKPPLALSAANRDGVSLLVEPRRTVTEMRAISTVLVRRGGVVRKPARQVITPKVYQTALGVRAAATEGQFFFSDDVFRPDDTIEIGFIATNEPDSICRMDRFTLARLR